MDCNFHLFAIGVSHNCMDATLLGAHLLRKEQIAPAYTALLKSEGLSEALILSTCNRAEFYINAANKDAALGAVNAAMSVAGGFTKEFELSCYVKEDVEAVMHAFAVASGLDSQMTGETEILRQVKDAYAAAMQAGGCKAVLNRIFQKAMQAAKWVRTNTEIGRGKISVGSVSSELAVRIFEDLQSVKILLIGTGEVGHLVAEALFIRGAKDITVSNRTWEKAYGLSMKVGGGALPFELALTKLADFDIVVCATNAEKPLITLNMASDAAKKRGSKAHFLIDLGAPRNIEDCEDVENAFLYRLEDLAKIANENLALRKSEISYALEELAKKAEYSARAIGLSEG